MRSLLGLLGVLLVLGACQKEGSSAQAGDREINYDTVQITDAIEWQGHRGCRGLMPENTVPAFLTALNYKRIKTLEMDIVLSKDDIPIVSHEPWMSPDICQLKSGAPMEGDPKEYHSIRNMTYQNILQYDCGTIFQENFPAQKQMSIHKPTLFSAVNAVRSHCKNRNRSMPNFSIELKSRPEWYGGLVPEPAAYVKAVLKNLNLLQVETEVTLQSFDVNILNELNKQAPNTYKMVYLVDNEEGLEANLAQLDFTPAVYSPHYRLVTPELIEAVKSKEMRLITWTVNEVNDMKRLIRMGVDGIITDYPDKIADVYKPIK